MRVRAAFRALPNPVRHVGSISATTALAQMILLMASPFLTRIYSPTQMGAFAALTGVAALLATVAGASYPTAIPLAKGPIEASDLTWITLGLTTAVSLIGGLVVWQVAPGWASDAPSNEPVAVLFTGTVFVLAAWAALRALAARENRFGSIATSGIADSGVQAGAQVGLGFAGLGSTGLVGGYIAGKAAALTILTASTRRYIIRPREPFRAAREWLRYPIWVTPTALLNQASVGAVSPFVAWLYGAAVAGQLSLAMRMLAVPSVFLGQAVSTVFFPKMAQMSRDERDLLPSVESTARVLLIVALPVFGFVVLLGPELFALVFGPEWRYAGVIAAILAPWLALNLVSSPISSVATVHDRLRTLLVLGTVEASVRFAALWTGQVTGHATVGFIAYSIAGCSISLYFLGWTFRLCGGSLSSWLARGWRTSATFVFSAAVLLGSKPLIPSIAYALAAIALCLALGLQGIREIRSVLAGDGTN